MEKKIEQYLPLYLGNKVVVYNNDGSIDNIIQLVGFDFDGNAIGYINGIKSLRYHSLGRKVKLILRPLSSMTEEEMKELYAFVFKKRTFVGDNITHRDIGTKEERWVLWSGLERLFIYKDGDVGADIDLHHFRVNHPEVVRWQLSKGFDIFGLKEKGLCLYPEEL